MARSQSGTVLAGLGRKRCASFYLYLLSPAKAQNISNGALIRYQPASITPLLKHMPLTVIQRLRRTPRCGRAGPVASAALCFPSSLPIAAYPGQGERSEFVSPPDSTQVAHSTTDGRDFSSVVCPAMAPPVTHGPPVTSEQRNLPSPPGQGGSFGPGP